MKQSIARLVACPLLLSAMAFGAPSQRPDGREVLAVHETLAVFNGVDFHLCKGLTAMCPERCGHSGEFAAFGIVKYLAYEKPGEYGDKKQPSFSVQISNFDRNPVGDGQLHEQITDLEEGDYVLLSWQHDYVTKNKSSFPERPVTKLARIEKSEAEALVESPRTGD